MKIGKKVAISIIAVMIALMINTKVQAAQVKVTTDTLRLRKEPNTTSSIVALLSMGEVYEVIEESGEWYKIQADDDVVGYVKKEFVKVEGEDKVEEQPVEQPVEEDPVEEEPVENEPTTSEQEPTSKNRKLKEDTELRSLPLFSSVSLETLKQNETVMLITQNNRWAYIQTETQSGWILADRLVLQNEEETTVEENTTDQESETETKVGYINSENVNFRKEDSTSSSVIKKLPLNTEVKILSETNTWSKVEINGTVGYVSKQYISDSKVEVTSRSLEVERTVEKIEEEQPESVEEQKTEEPIREEVTDLASDQGEEVVALAKTFLGNQYIYAAEGPKNFDCSGFTLYVFKQYGVTLPHSAASQIKYGEEVAKSELKAGDVVFFQDQEKTKVGHVGIYMGDGNFIHSSSAVGEVTITPLSKSYYETRFVGARRYL